MTTACKRKKVICIITNCLSCKKGTFHNKVRMYISLVLPKYLSFWWINMFLIHNKEGIRTSIKIQINIFFDNKIKDCSVGSSPSLLWWYPMRHLQKKKKNKGWLSVICWKCIIRRGELKNQSGVGVNLTPTHTFL